MSTLGKPIMGTDPKDWKWQQVAEVGAFRGHPAGPFELSPAIFDEIVRNFKEDGLPIAWDLEHASEADPTSGSIPTTGTPAQGWIHDLDNRGVAGLWALTEWGPQAKEYVASGKYVYCSPAVRFNCKSRITGKPIGARLTSVALTNSPFLKGLRPLAAKASGLPGDVAEDVGAAVSVTLAGKGLGRLLHSPADYMPAIKGALKLHELASPMECADHLQRLRDRCMGDGSTSYDGIDTTEYIKPLMSLVGAAPGMSLGDLFGLIEQMIQHAIDQHVAQYHGDATTDVAPDMPTSDYALDEDVTGDGDMEMTMSDTKALKDAQDSAKLAEERLALANDKITAADKRVAALEVSLKDTTERADAAEATVKTIAAAIALKDGEKVEDAIARVVETNTKLLADKAAAEEADLLRDVERAWDDYKDIRNLDAKTGKATLLKLARASREVFAEMYPALTHDQARALMKVTPPAPRPAPEDAKIEPAKDPKALGLTALTRKLMKDESLSFFDAERKAVALLNAKSAG